MEIGFVHLHNLLRWIILVLLVLSVIKSYIGWKQQKSEVSPGDRKIWLFTMIASHITLLLGLYQWFAGRYGLFTYLSEDGTSMMKNAYLRFYQLEHPTTMIIAIILITLGYGMAKKFMAGEKKYRKAFFYFTIALVLILVRIPWPFMENVGRPLFPGMN